jgi:ribosomal protein S18 acetylase RimI-like enzyme
VSVAPVSVIRLGQEKARTSPWRGDDMTALLSPAPDAPLLSGPFVRHCLETLAGQGFVRVVTAALSPLEQAGFLAAGFGVEQDLRLLGIDLRTLAVVVPAGPRLRRVPRRRRAAVLAVDNAAFAEFWRFDERALEDALEATPRVRFRLTGGRATVTAYAVSGRAGRRGYVQRLAVHPDHQGHGLGRRLLMDGLRWMADEGVVRAYVNTQTTNDRALALYEAVGFEEEPIGLSVLSTGLA